MSKKQNAILIVDDDKSIRTSLAAILEQEGYEVDKAENGSEAIEKSNNRIFDLVLVDMRLPDMMGTELLSKVKERTPPTAKIMVTGYPSMQNAINSVNEGADGYLLKPVDAETLLNAIRTHLQKREEAAKFSEKKVAEYLETRTAELTRSRQEQSKPS